MNELHHLLKPSTKKHLLKMCVEKTHTHNEIKYVFIM